MSKSLCYEYRTFTAVLVYMYLVKTVVFIWKSWDLQDWVIEIISPETSYIIVDYRIYSYSFRPWISFLPWIVSRAKIKFTSWKIEILRQLHEFAIISKI